MNIFEHLGLAEDHRRHPFQLVKHRDEVPEAKLTYPVYGQVKRDGIFCAVVVKQDGSVSIFGRTGKKLANTEALEQDLYRRALPLGVYLGELQSMAVDVYLEALSGVVNPNRTEPLDYIAQQIKDGLYIDFFDMLTLKAFIDGYTDVTFVKRHDALVRRLQHNLAIGEHNILPITPLADDIEVQMFADEHINAGREGAVFKLDCDYEAGHKGYRQTKKVRGLNVDLTCVGYEEGKGKCQGMVAKLIFKWKGGKTMKAGCGKGWTHELLTQMFHDIKYGGELNVIGKIFAVKGLQESSKGGGIRLPKFGELRHDKETPDVI